MLPRHMVDQHSACLPRASQQLRKAAAVTGLILVHWLPSPQLRQGIKPSTHQYTGLLGIDCSHL